MIKMGEKAVIRLYYDVISPYAWIGFEGLLRYQKHFSVEVELKPFFLREIMITVGNRPPSFVPRKGAYILKDLKRNAAFYGLDIRPRQLAASGTLIPKDANWLPDASKTTEGVVKVLLAVQQVEPEKLIDVSRLFWNRLWTDSKPIFSDDDFLNVLSECSAISPNLIIERSKTEEVVRALKRNTEEALELGCFGAPWFHIDYGTTNESFWGADRFHQIADLLGHERFSYELLRQ